MMARQLRLQSQNSVSVTKKQRQRLGHGERVNLFVRACIMWKKVSTDLYWGLC
jgi:hypothetical protein